MVTELAGIMEENPYEPPRSASSRVLTLGFLGAIYVASIALSTLTWVLLIYAAFHVEIDRTNLRPVATWVGPVAAWGHRLGDIVTWLILAALILASPAIVWADRGQPWGDRAIFLGFLAMFGGIAFFAFL